MARPVRQKTPWEMYILAIIVVVLVISGLALVIGPTGSLKEATDNIKAYDKRKMEKPEVFQALDRAINKAKPKGKKWGDLTDEERERMVELAYQDMKSQGFDKDIRVRDVKSKVNELWREKMTDEQVLPSDDPKERWKQLTGNKFETIRRIDLRDDSGFLNCPQIDIFEDAGKATNAGVLNHDEWVVILEEQGAMAKVKRRRDKKEGWIESKWLRRIYTNEDIEKGPSKKIEERDE